MLKHEKLKQDLLNTVMSYEIKEDIEELIKAYDRRISSLNNQVNVLRFTLEGKPESQINLSEGSREKRLSRIIEVLQSSDDMSFVKLYHTLRRQGMSCKKVIFRNDLEILEKRRLVVIQGVVRLA